MICAKLFEYIIREISSSPQTIGNSGFAGSISFQPVEKFIFSGYNKAREGSDKSVFVGRIDMTITKIEKNGIICAIINSDDIVIADAQSALDVLMTAKYDAGTKNIVISKKLIVEDFFILSTGLAGEILQKYINYGGRIAIYGDYTHYTSKPLHDFIYESNKGKDVFFVATEDEAIEMLTR